jgi:hypothetical protein
MGEYQAFPGACQIGGRDGRGEKMVEGARGGKCTRARAKIRGNFWRFFFSAFLQFNSHCSALNL